jgi:hypothetical protein
LKDRRRRIDVGRGQFSELSRVQRPCPNEHFTSLSGPRHFSLWPFSCSRRPRQERMEAVVEGTEAATLRLVDIPMQASPTIMEGAEGEDRRELTRLRRSRRSRSTPTTCPRPGCTATCSTSSTSTSRPISDGTSAWSRAFPAETIRTAGQVLPYMIVRWPFRTPRPRIATC